MDIALAVLSITTLAVRASSKLWTISGEWRDAPADLYKLRDDVSGAERFFREIQQHVDESPRMGPFPKEASRLVVDSPSSELSTSDFELGRLVDEGACTLRQIEEIVDGLAAAVFSGDAGPPNDRVLNMGRRRKLRWLRQSGKVARLRKELNHTRSSICQLLISQNIVISANISASLERSHSQVLLQMSGLSTSIEASHARIEKRMETLEERVMFLGVRDGREDYLAIEQAPPEHTRSDGGTPNFLTEHNTAIPSRRESPCDITCICSCHRVTSHAWNMGILRSMVGVIAVAYTRWTSGPCTNPSCHDMGQRRVVRDMYLTYHPPDWLSRSSILAFFSNNLNGSPHLALRVYYRREWDQFGVISVMESGDVEGVKSRLRRGLLSIYDLFGEPGYPIMYLAFLMESARGNHGYKITKVLLQAGADPFKKSEDETRGDSFASMAFYHTLGLPEGCAELVTLLPLHRYIEDSDFTTLHLAVMGILHVDLAKMLQDPTYIGDINAKALNGLTPLHLAALRGDPHAAQLLARAGANLESPTSKGSVPLFLAARYGHLEVVHALTGAGANPSATDTTGMQPIHGAAVADQNSTSIISLLLQHGVDLASRDEEGYTALTFALGRGADNTVCFLLERGAEPNTGPDDGLPLLFVAVVTAGHAKVELLLQHGADMAVTENGWPGYNVLHYIAHAGDVEMMEIFTGREFRGGIDASLRGGDGKTPLDMLNERDPGSEVREAFDRLLESVGKQNRVNMAMGGDADGAGSDGDMEFFDAEDGGDKDVGI